MSSFGSYEFNSELPSSFDCVKVERVNWSIYDEMFFSESSLKQPDGTASTGLIMLPFNFWPPLGYETLETKYLQKLGNLVGSQLKMTYSIDPLVHN